MLHRVRGSSAPSQRVRFQLVLASCLTIAGSLSALTSASAQVPPTSSPATSDSLATIQRPAQTPTQPLTQPQTQTQTQTTPATALPKPKANSIDLYGGLYAPTETNAPGPTLGMRLGRRISGHLQGGLLVDWTFQRKNVEQPINSLPGLQPQLILARADGQLIPVMAFFEVNLTETRYFVPFAGFAAGYEWLTLHAENYQTGESASATYTNFAWQGWVGMGMRLDQKVRVDFELGYNGGSLERDSPTTAGFTEAVRVNGVGAKVGLNIAY